MRTRTSCNKIAVGAMALAGAVGVAAQSAGDITEVGSTLVSAMMMYLGNDDKVYILDKAENNPQQIDGHPAYGAVWDIASKTAEPYRVMSNPFCAAGSHMPNGDFATFGGNAATTRNESQVTGIQDWQEAGPSPDYGVTDGRQAVRIVTPCTGSVASFADACQEKNPGQMLRRRWYATAEALGDGTIIIVGGMVYGGYINRSDKWFTDPKSQDAANQHGNAENSLEFYPSRPAAGKDGVVALDFLGRAGGLNTYSHLFLMPSGKIFMNANVSSILYDTTTFTETQLPDDPNNVVRVYPASAGVAMLPLTPENNWTPTILFCGGTNSLSDVEWGTYHSPGGNVWEKQASDDCQRLTPEPTDGTAAAYEADDAMPDPRTMGQFVALPDGTFLMVNGARMGTAGYTTDTPAIPSLAQMPFYMSIATDPVYTPAIYDPSKPKGQRWNSTGLKASAIPRMYHSTALLLPDGSVMVAGSNPGADVSVKADNIPYPTTYEAEYFYPAYFNEKRPAPTGVPATLAYGGASFQLKLSAGQYTSPNDAASKTKVVLMRPGFTTHAMSMGQRHLQLNSTYQVSDDGSITLSVSSLPPNANLFTPGPALLYVVVDGVPSIGKHLIVGNGAVGAQPVAAAAALPAIATSSKFATAGETNSGGNGGKGSNGDKSDDAGGLSIGVYAAIGAAAVALIALIGFCLWRRRRNARVEGPGAAVAAAGAASGARSSPYAMDNGGGNPYASGRPSMAQTGSNVNMPLTANYDYERSAAVGSPAPSQRSLGSNAPYNSAPQREYQPQGGYQQSGGYQQGGYQQGGYQQGGYPQQQQQQQQYNQYAQNRGGY